MGLNVASTAMEWLLESYECLMSYNITLPSLSLYSKVFTYGAMTQNLSKKIWNIFAKKLLLVLFIVTDLDQKEMLPEMKCAEHTRMLSTFFQRNPGSV